MTNVKLILYFATGERMLNSTENIKIETYTKNEVCKCAQGQLNNFDDYQ